MQEEREVLFAADALQRVFEIGEPRRLVRSRLPHSRGCRRRGCAQAVGRNLDEQILKNRARHKSEPRVQRERIQVQQARDEPRGFLALPRFLQREHHHLLGDAPACRGGRGRDDAHGQVRLPLMREAHAEEFTVRGGARGDGLAGIKRFVDLREEQERVG